jgi:hypothetical protein
MVSNREAVGGIDRLTEIVQTCFRVLVAIVRCIQEEYTSF